MRDTMEQSDTAQAKMMAADLEHIYSSDGFKIFWDQYHREIKRAEIWVMETSKGEASNTSRIALELRYRQGFLDGLIQLGEFKGDLLKVLKSGRMPWRENNR